MCNQRPYDLVSSPPHVFLSHNLSLSLVVFFSLPRHLLTLSFSSFSLLASPSDGNYFHREGTAGRTSLSPLSFFSLTFYFFSSFFLSLFISRFQSPSSSPPPSSFSPLPFYLPEFLSSLSLTRWISLSSRNGFLSL